MKIIHLSKLLGRWGAVGGLVLAGLFLAGCKSDSGRFAPLPGDLNPTASVGDSSTGAAITQTASSPEAAVGPDGGPLEVFHEGDEVVVTFKDLPIPEPPIEDRIKDDGAITLLQNQTFHVAGKTRSQVETEIHDRYVPTFFRNMTVTFRHKPETRFYYVGGEVKTPGRQIYISRIKVLGAIKSAGDFTDFAKRSAVELTRANGIKTNIDCNAAQNDPKKDMEVYPGDNIYVPRRWFSN